MATIEGTTMSLAAARLTDRSEPDPFARLIAGAPMLLLAMALAPLSWIAGFALLGRARLGPGALLLVASAAGFVLYYLVLSEVGWEPPRSGLF